MSHALLLQPRPLVPSQHTEEPGSWNLCLSTAGRPGAQTRREDVPSPSTATGTLSSSIAAAQARNGHLATRPSNACASLVHPPATSAAEEPFLLEPAPTTAAGLDTEDPTGPGDLRQDDDADTWGSSSPDRARLSPALATLQPEVPFAFVSFDIFRGPIVYHLPHGQGPAEAVFHALQHAPFPNPAWTRTRAHVPGFPQLQILLMRDRAPVTVILDARPLEGEVFVAEVGPGPITGQQLAAHAPFDGRAPIVGQVLRASQLILYHNHRPWAMAYSLRLISGDLICFASRAGSFLQVHAGLQWSPHAATNNRGPPLLVARSGLRGSTPGWGWCPARTSCWPWQEPSATCSRRLRTSTATFWSRRPFRMLLVRRTAKSVLWRLRRSKVKHRLYGSTAGR